MSNSIQKPFVLDWVVCVLSLLELSDGLHPRHGPVRELPGFRPPDVTVLCVEYHNSDFKVFVPYAGTQTRACVGSDASLDSIDASLSQHHVRVVPFVCFPVSIRIFLDSEKLGTHDLSELLHLHALCRQLRNVEGRRLVLSI